MDNDKPASSVDQFEKAGQQAAQIFGRFVKVASEMGGELKREYEKEINRSTDDQPVANEKEGEHTISTSQSLQQDRLDRLNDIFSADSELADLSEQQFDSLLQYMKGSYLQATALFKK